MYVKLENGLIRLTNCKVSVRSILNLNFYVYFIVFVTRINYVLQDYNSLEPLHTIQIQYESSYGRVVIYMAVPNGTMIYFTAFDSYVSSINHTD